MNIFPIAAIFLQTTSPSLCFATRSRRLNFVYRVASGAVQVFNKRSAQESLLRAHWVRWACCCCCFIDSVVSTTTTTEWKTKSFAGLSKAKTANWALSRIRLWTCEAAGQDIMLPWLGRGSLLDLICINYFSSMHRQVLSTYECCVEFVHLKWCRSLGMFARGGGNLILESNSEGEGVGVVRRLILAFVGKFSWQTNCLPCWLVFYAGIGC